MRWNRESIGHRENVVLFLLLFFLLIQITHVEMKLGSFRQDLQALSSSISETQDRLLSVEEDVETANGNTRDALEDINSQITAIERKLRLLAY